MLDVTTLSDAELRAELIARGMNIGPVTGTTRALFEKKLNGFLSKKGPAKSTPAKSTSAKPTPTKSTPSKTAVIKPTTASKKSPSPARSAKTLNTTTTTTTTRRSIAASSNKSQLEEEESDDDIDVFIPVITKPSKSPTPTKTKLNDSISSVKSTKYPVVHKKISSFNDDIHVPNLITSFEPNYSIIDRPGATPPRGTKISTSTIRQSVTKPSYNSSTTRSFGSKFNDIGATTGEEDNDDDEDGLETSRIVYSSKNSNSGGRGLVGKAWDKVLGYDFKTSSTPGQSYDFRTGNTRTRVVRDKKTGKLVVEQSSVFGEALNLALYVLVILFVALSIGYFISSSDKSTVSGTISLLTKSARDSINFVYHYAIIPVATILAIGVIGAGSYYGHKKYKENVEKEEAATFDLIEKIIELIKEAAVEGEAYVSQPHIRDVIFPPAKRRGTELSRWERAVAFIDANESRVATEIRVLPSGNECAIWKWIGNTQTKRNW